jgi:uncharacterized protein YxjI
LDVVGGTSDGIAKHAAQPQEVDMANGDYQRTCNMCHHTWSVPAGIAEERPNMKGLASQFASTVGATFDEQLALRTHYQQLANAAKCPQCGATSFTQQKVAGAPISPDSPTTPQAPAETPPSIPAASNMPDGQNQTFVLNQKLISLTGDLWIEDGKGNRAFEVDGKLLSMHGTHMLKDLNGQPLYEISKPLAPHLHKTIEIKKDGHVSATVQEAIFHLGGDKFKITLAGGQEFTVHGNWSNRVFQVKDQGGRLVIDASRMWFSIRDAYGIQIAPDFEVPLGLAICVALERVEAQEQGNESPVQNLLGGIGPF